MYTVAWLWSSKTLLVNIVGRVASLAQVRPPFVFSIIFNLRVLGCEKGVGLKSCSLARGPVYLVYNWVAVSIPALLGENEKHKLCVNF